MYNVVTYASSAGIHNMSKTTKTTKSKTQQQSRTKKKPSSINLTAAAVKRALKEKCIPEKAAFFPRFFKSGKGEYGEGDKFLGVIVPEQRKIAKTFRELPTAEIAKLLDDAFHECRLTGVLILVLQFEKEKNAKSRQAICDFYVKKLDRVNNWDLVDSSAHKILGPLLWETGDRKLLYKLAKSKHLWRERAAMIATLCFIKHDDYEDTIKLAEGFMNHKHDLMHKAVGWMLREMGKRDQKVLIAFLDTWHQKMPRTMLRYSLEHFDKAKRAKWM